MRGWWVCSNWYSLGWSVPALMLVFALYLNPSIHCMKLVDHMPRKVSAYKISGSLRYLSKAVFTKALTGGKTLLSNKTMFRKLGELKNNSIYDYNFNGSMH